MEASLNSDGSKFGTSSPYIKIYHNSQVNQWKTPTARGHNPKWNYQISINQFRDLDGIKFEVWDSNLVFDRIKGQTLNLKISDMTSSDETIELSLYKDN